MRSTAPGAIRRYYENRKMPICPTSAARHDVLALLEDRKAIARAGEALLIAAVPYSGDATLKDAIEAFRAAFEGRLQT